MLWDKSTDQAANPEQKQALLMRGMNMEHEAQLAKESEGKAWLVEEKFAGKSFDDKTNDLLYWEPSVETEGETDAE